MASSRLEKVGTIFTRITALLRTGAMKPEDQPIWYNVYKAFPPKLEPRYDRPAPQIDIQPIFYKEDVIRAKFHKKIRQTQSISLSSDRSTETQMFIDIYRHLEAQGALSDEQIFETAVELLEEKLQKQRTDRDSIVDEMKLEQQRPSLSQQFSQAQTQKLTEINKEESIDVKNIFKD